MKRQVILLFVALWAVCSFADDFPKSVTKARQSVASVVTYRQGVMLHNGTAVFVGNNGDVLSSYSLFAGADSAVVIDSKGVARTVSHIVGVNSILDCIRVRVAADKKIKPLAASSAPVAVDGTLYMLGYGIGKGGFVEQARVERVDSAYSCAYYTLARPMEQRFLSLPLVDGNGELVAVMQPASAVDTVKSYAIGASVYELLDVSVADYGRGFYPSMGIRTALPSKKEDALSCLYMQTILGDSASYGGVIRDFMSAYPDSYEGYLAKAEFEAVLQGDVNAAVKSWDKAFKLAGNKAEVHFAKAKAINTLVLAGDTVSHPLLTFANAISEVDKAIALGNQPLYIVGKADMLYSHGDYAAAAACYALLADTELRSADNFAKAAQCYSNMKEYDKSVAMLDSALCCFDEASEKSSAPYILTRALVNSAAGKHRDAVLDYNRYEELMAGSLGADFYYLREQAELNAKMYQQALNDIDTAIYLDPQNVGYYIEKGLLCYRVKLSDEGIRVLEDAMKIAPSSPDVYYLLGRLYVQKNDSRKALPLLEKAVELGHPDAGNIISRLAE